MFKGIVNFFKPFRNFDAVYKPDKRSHIINLPNGHFITTSKGKDGLGRGPFVVAEKDGKYYGVNKIKGKWIVDQLPIEFEPDQEEEKVSDYYGEEELYNESA